MRYKVTHSVLIAPDPAIVEASICIANAHSQTGTSTVWFKIIDKVYVVCTEIGIAEFSACSNSMTGWPRSS